MLGLRRYHNVQIDIWQGDIAKFFVDVTTNDNGSPWSERFATATAKIKSEKPAHLSFAVESEASALQAMQSAKDFLPTQDLTKIRRLTFIASNSPIYDILQESLFHTFDDIQDQ